MHVVHFTPFSSLVGGVLIGVAASLLWLGNGRIAGVSGVCAGLVAPLRGDTAWRATFVLGLLAGGVLTYLRAPESFSTGLVRSAPVLVLAGVLVGAGARLANGCTSGHGVCGLGRLSPRSMAAVGTFMATGALTVIAVDHWFGGQL